MISQGSSNHEAFLLEAMQLPDDSHMLQSAEILGETDPQTTNMTSEPLKHQVYTSDRPLLAWIPHRATFLDELTCHEGQCGSHSSVCIRCQKHDRVYHCEDCFSSELHCHNCIVKLHVSLPLHRVKVHTRCQSNNTALTIPQEWSSTFFIQIPLKSLGLHVQLGHPASQSCIRPLPAGTNDDFVVINTNGVHEVGLDFCGCETAQSQMKQLL
ncbi:hypothetical protein J3R82DRAFT_8298 [Butyriboletus roseoflavus]|nr:hypothetical protein J3R82DRAFT_8298 [Butyriboletus roseoflavus]